MARKAQEKAEAPAPEAQIEAPAPEAQIEAPAPEAQIEAPAPEAGKPSAPASKFDPAELAAYAVLTPIEHDRRSYLVGAVIAFTDAEAAPLLAVGAIEQE